MNSWETLGTPPSFMQIHTGKDVSYSEGSMYQDE